jgi:hypothetical protein
MSVQVLAKQKKYIDNYVALESFDANRVVAFGKDPAEVLATAEGKGFQSPVLVYVPSTTMTHIY